MKAYHWKVIKRSTYDIVEDPDFVDQQSIEWLVDQAFRSYGIIEHIDVVRHEIVGEPIDSTCVPGAALAWAEVGDVVLITVTCHNQEASPS